METKTFNYAKVQHVVEMKKRVKDVVPEMIDLEFYRSLHICSQQQPHPNWKELEHELTQLLSHRLS